MTFIDRSLGLGIGVILSLGVARAAGAQGLDAEGFDYDACVAVTHDIEGCTRKAYEETFKPAPHPAPVIRNYSCTGADLTGGSGAKVRFGLQTTDSVPIVMDFHAEQGEFAGLHLRFTTASPDCDRPYFPAPRIGAACWAGRDWYATQPALSRDTWAGEGFYLVHVPSGVLETPASPEGFAMTLTLLTPPSPSSRVKTPSYEFVASCQPRP